MKKNSICLTTRVNNVLVVPVTPKPQLEAKREAKETDRLGFFAKNEPSKKGTVLEDEA